MSENEFSNMFGTITEDRVTYFRKKSWFSGGSREDVPLKHVTSVRYDIARNAVFGVILVLVGLAMFSSPKAVVLGVPIAALGILLVWGSPMVVVNTSGNDLNTMKSWPWNRGAAQEFADALRKKLFKD